MRANGGEVEARKSGRPVEGKANGGGGVDADEDGSVRDGRFEWMVLTEMCI